MLHAFLQRAVVRRAILALAVLAMLAHIAVTVYWRSHRLGDFDAHREFGRRFLAGEPLYADGICFNYMPVSAMYWSPWALLPSMAGTAVRYVAAIGCLWLVLRWLAAMVRPRCDAARFSAFEVSLIALVLASHYLVRDLDDGGPHIILLAMLVGGLYAAWRGREWTAAAAIGAAVALKMTPGLLIPYFVWKRRWRLAVATTLCSAAWIASPAFWMGPAAWWSAQSEWNRVAASVAHGGGDSLRTMNEDRVQNQALRPALARFLIARPAGTAERAAHRWDVDFLDLDHKTADRLTLAACAMLLLIFGWWSRHRSKSTRDAAWIVETSGVLVLTVLLSPVTWLQHVVFILPAIYLIVAQDRMATGLPSAARMAMYAYVALALVLNRELMGKSNYMLLLSLHIHTLAMLIILAVLMAVRPTQRSLGTTRQEPQAPRSAAGYARAA